MIGCVELMHSLTETESEKFFTLNCEMFSFFPLAFYYFNKIIDDKLHAILMKLQFQCLYYEPLTNYRTIVTFTHLCN